MHQERRKKKIIFPYIAICFIFSGAASLALEVIWSKYFALLLGSTVYGLSTVVGAFMAGLGLGSYMAGKLSERLRNQIRAYAWLEGIVGLFALSSPLLFLNLHPLFDRLYDLSFHSLSFFLLVRFIILFLILLIPTIAMGASLPLLVEYFARYQPEGRGHIGTLYALNTAGAVLGTIFAGFYLIPRFGLARSTIIAGSIDLAIFVFLLLQAFPPIVPVRTDGGRDDSKENKKGKQSLRTLPNALRTWKGPFIAFIFGFSGFLALIYQVSWTRTLIVTLGSSVYCFTIILAIYLGGLAGGSSFASRLAEWTSSPLAWFGFLESVVALTAYLGTYWAKRLPHWTAWAFRTSGGDPSSFFSYETLIALPIVLPPTIALGALFPIAARSYRDMIRKTGKAVGTIYATNTLGTILGSLGAGFLFIPLMGARQTILMAAIASAFIGLLALAIASHSFYLKTVSYATAIMTILAVLFWPPLVRLSDVNYGLVSILRDEELRRFHHSPSPQGSLQGSSPLQRAPSLERLIFYREGLNAAVAVSTDDRHRYLLINGKGDASTLPGDMMTQSLLGHLPMMFLPKARYALVIGLGIGVTTHAVLTYPGIERVDTIEIESAVIEASHYFKDVNKNVLQDPRHHLIVEDARVWLAYCDQEYDVIISEPSNPWIAGINNLFTKDFYHQLRQKLSSKGIFCQWIHTYEISEDSIFLVLRTLGSIFPNAHVFYLSDFGDMLIVAQRDPAQKPVLDDVFSIPSVAADLAILGIHEPADIGRFYKTSLKKILAGHEEGRLNTDDNCYLEHRAPLELINPSIQPFVFFMRKAYFDDYHKLFFPHLSAGKVLVDSGRLAARSDHYEYSLWALEICEDRGFKESVALLKPEVEKAKHRRSIRSAIDAYLEKAEYLRSTHQWMKALAVLKKAGALDPFDNEVLSRAGLILMELNRQKEAEYIFQLLIRRADPDYLYMAHVNLGILLHRRQAYQEALSEFDQAKEFNPYLGPAYYFGSMTLESMDRLDEAIAYLRQGLKYGSDDATLLVQMATLLEKSGLYRKARQFRRQAARFGP